MVMGSRTSSRSSESGESRLSDVSDDSRLSSAPSSSDESSASKTPRMRLRASPRTLCVDLSKERTSDRPYVGTVALLNNNEHPVAFKVKTTKRSRYSVRPNHGVLEAYESVDITIAMHYRDFEDLKALGPGARAGGDKFLFAATKLEPLEREVLQLLKEAATSDDDADEAKREVGEKTLMAKIDAFFVDKPKHERAARRVPLSFENSVAVAVKEASPENDQPPETSIVRSTSSRTASKNRRVSPTSSRGARKGVLASLFFLSQRSSPGGGAEETAALRSDLDALRQKYSDLLEYTVRTTQERDALKEALEEKTSKAAASEPTSLRVE